VHNGARRNTHNPGSVTFQIILMSMNKKWFSFLTQSRLVVALKEKVPALVGELSKQQKQKITKKNGC